MFAAASAVGADNNNPMPLVSMAKIKYKAKSLLNNRPNSINSGTPNENGGWNEDQT
jgi:hypothetical protein